MAVTTLVLFDIAYKAFHCNEVEQFLQAQSICCNTAGIDSGIQAVYVFLNQINEKL